MGNDDRLMGATWKVFAASVQGKSHIDLGLPCQDAHAFEVRETWLVAVVCDGAGSALHSQRGAAFTSQQIVKRLIERVETASLDQARSELAAIVTSVRDELSAIAATEALSVELFASTLVGVVAGPEQGFLFHIGDGAGIIELGGEEASLLISAPENGEYANETYFLTDERWPEHLRIIEFKGTPACIGLMSDGPMPFVMNGSRGDFSRPFIDPVTRYLLANDEATGSEALGNVLASEGTWSITGDDKTLLLAYPVDR
jgi:hypothetical protein